MGIKGGSICLDLDQTNLIIDAGFYCMDLFMNKPKAHSLHTLYKFMPGKKKEYIFNNSFKNDLSKFAFMSKWMLYQMVIALIFVYIVKFVSFRQVMFSVPKGV